MNPARALRLGLLSLAALLLGVVLAGVVALRLLAPQPGEWAMPLRIGPWRTRSDSPESWRHQDAPRRVGSRAFGQIARRLTGEDSPPIG